MRRGLTWLASAWRGKRALEVQQAYRDIFGSPAGQALLKDLALYCNMTHSSFAPNAPDVTAFHEGQRDVFLHIQELCGLSQAALLALLQQSEVSLEPPLEPLHAFSAASPKSDTFNLNG